MNSLSLDQIRVFLTVVEEGSFSAAARRLHRAQSAVSYAIGNLERLLEVSLFDRSKRRPQLTDSGRAILADARSISFRVSELEARTRRLSEGVEAEVCIAVEVMYPMPLLLNVLAQFREAYPGVAITLHNEALGAVIRLVDRGVAQIGVCGPLSEPPRGIIRRPLLKVSMIPVVAPEHPLARWEGPIPTQELCTHTQLVLTDRSALTTGMTAAVMGGPTWKFVDLGAKHSCLKAGLGWGNMPRHMVRKDLESGALVRVEVEEWESEIEITLFSINRQDNPPGPAGRWLLDHLCT